jgi:antitoxin CcdA
MKPMSNCNPSTTPKANASKSETLSKVCHAHSFVRMNMQSKITKKKAVNLSIDSELLADTKARGVNLSSFLEEKLREARVIEWKRANAEAIRQENEFIEKHGIWSDGMRSW